MRKRNLLSNTLYVILFSLLVIFSSCKKTEEPVPIQDGPVTVVQSNLTLGNLVAADTNIQTNEDSLLVYYFQQDTIFRFIPSDFYSSFTFSEFEEQMKLGLVEIPEFTFGFNFILNDMLTYFNQDLADSLIQYDSTFHIFPPLLLNETMNIDNGPSDDYIALAIKSGKIEIKVQNTLPVAIENLHFSVLDIQYNKIIKDLTIDQLDSNSVYTTNVSLIGNKFSNHFGVSLISFSSPGSDTNELMINLSEGLNIGLKLKNVISAGGITKVNAQLIGTVERWIDINTAPGERFFNALYEKGTMSLSVVGMNKVNLVVYYTLPSVIRNQTIVSDFVYAIQNQISEKDTLRQGMNFDFSSFTPRPYNRFPVKIDVYLQASDTLLSIDTSDMAEIRLTFNDDPPYYTNGFYGKKIIHSTPSVVDINPEIAGQEFVNILFAEPSLTFSYYNNLNLPLKILPSLSAVNYTSSESALLITDSVKILYPLIQGESATTEVSFDVTNSNVKDLFDINPAQFIVNIDGRTNWNGQGENFSWDTCAFYGNLSLKIPLVLQSNFLLFSDTVPVNLNIQNLGDATGKLKLKAVNGFPFSMKLKLMLYDPVSDAVSETIDFGNIASAEVGLDGKVNKTVETVVEFKVEKSLIENLIKSEKGLIIMESTTFENGGVPVSLYSNYKTLIAITFEKEEK